MNFKTTIVLIVVLAAAGFYWAFTSRESPKSETTGDSTKLVDVDAKDVTKLIVTPTDGAEFTLEKIGTEWQIIEPVKAAAETFEVDSLVRAITDAKTHGEVAADSSSLAKPRYQVQLVSPSKTVKLAIGEKSPVGDNLYVKVDGASQGEIIPADLSDKLDKGIDPYRKMNLVTAPSDQIKQITITRGDEKLQLQKNGEHWQIISPTNMPADDSAVSDLVFAITGLRADSFVDSSSVPATALAHPQLTVAFTSAAPFLPPATAPSTAPVWTTIEFGSFDDILKKKVYATIENSGTIAKVPATSLDSFKKKPLEFRDKKAVNIDPEQASKIVLAIDLPSTTQPTTKPAVNKTVTIERRKITPPVAGPALPTTQTATTQLATTMPTTGPTTLASTMPATAPVVPESKWMVTSDPGGSADDAKVTTLLNALHPLTADKYLENAATTQPAGRYVLTITTVAPGGQPVDSQISVIDPGHDQPLIGSSNGLSFETARSLLTDFEGEWIKK